MQSGKGQGSWAQRVAHLIALAAVIVLAWPAPLAEAQTRPRPRPDIAASIGAQPLGERPKPRPAAPAANAAPVAGAPAAQSIGPQSIGPVSKLPLPRYASLKANEGNARRGPGLTHRIDWVFTTKGTPLRVVAEYENWRKVEDFEGFGGWVHFTLLSVARTVMVTQDLAPFYTLPDPSAPISFQAERGVLARVLECHIDWCRVNADGQRGWAPKSAFWGVEAQEVID